MSDYRVRAVNELAQDDVRDQYSAQFNIVDNYLASLAGMDIVTFNDNPNTQYADVINLFDRAIDNASTLNLLTAQKPGGGLRW